MIKNFDLTITAATLDRAGVPSASTPARIIVSDDIRDFVTLWPRSNRPGAALCFVFQCADILEVYCETVVPERAAEPCFIAIVNEYDQPLALLPFCIERRLGTRILRFIDGGLSELNAPVLFTTGDWTLETTGLIWNELRRILRFDIAMFEKMPACVGDWSNPLMFLKTSTDFCSCHAMTLRDSWENISARRPQRRTADRDVRRLASRGTVTVEIASSPQRYDAILEATMRQKTERYIETSGIDGLARPGYRSFLQTAGRLVYPTGPVCLFALKVDDVIVATVLGFVFGSRFYYFMPSFEAGEWATYSPGRILLNKILEWSVATGLELFDFGVGDEEYKRGYCDVSTVLYRAEVPSTGRGRCFLLLRKTKRLIDKLLKENAKWLARVVGRGTQSKAAAVSFRMRIEWKEKA